MDTLEQTANQALIKAIDAIESGSEFLAGEIPEVIEQLLAWHFYKSLILFVIGVLTLLAIAVFYVKSYKLRVSEDMFLTESGLWLYTVFGCIAWVVFGAVVDLNWLQILIAPKLYLLEYAAALVK